MSFETPDADEIISAADSEIPSSAANPLHNEHLARDERPIMASISGDRYRIYGETLDETTKAAFADDNGETEIVNFYSDKEQLDEQEMLNSGEQSYAISSINERPKRSFEYQNCTGIAVSATDKETGKQISFLSHQNPGRFLPWYRASKYKFDNDMSARMQEIKSRAVQGSIDVVLFGGNMRKNGSEHEESISVLSDICKRNFGFEPVVIAGPTIPEDIGGGTEVHLDTEHRRLHIARPPQQGDDTNISYVPSQFESQSVKFKKAWDERNSK